MSEGFPGNAEGLLAGFAIGSRIAGYRLEERIGAGGMAVVFRAIDERLSRPVALKAITPALAADADFRRRFIHESRAAAAVDDPHIIPVFEAGEAQGVLFIAMRFVPGGDVRQLMRREGPLPPERATAIISAVASALDAAHAAGLIHRDVKPANMLVDARPERPDHVYLSDFGLSKGALSSVGITGTGVFIGTLDYCSPEQIQGNPVDGRADQYSLACSAFELLVGSPPFVREQLPAVIWAHMSEQPPQVSSRRPDLGRRADPVFARAMAKAPQDRFPTCTEFANALRSALGVPPYHRASRPAAADQPGEDGPAPSHPVTATVSDPETTPRPEPARHTEPEPARAPEREPEPTMPPVAGPGPDLEPTRVRGAAWDAQPAPKAAATVGVVPPRDAATWQADRPGRRRRWIAAIAAGASIALVAVAFAVLGTGSPSHSPVVVQAAYGGTLRLVSSFTPDQVDPTDAYNTGDYVLERAYARQLVTFPTVPDRSTSSPGWTTDVTPVPDVASEVPTVANGGVSDGGRTYTFHIKPGVMWSTSPPRQVTAQDFVRAFKAMCNPVFPAPTEQYYTATIAGMSGYCAAEYDHFASAPRTAAGIARFQDANAISGVTALGPLTLRFDLTAPAADFLSLLALPFASARPAEYDAYLSGSTKLAGHLLSDGPYRVASYVAGKSLVLTMNPAWRQSTDAVRHRFVARITDSITSTSAAAEVSGERSGSYDLVLDNTVPSSDVADFLARHDPKFAIWPYGFLGYLVLNLRSPNAGSAMSKLGVRQAIEYGVDKTAVLAATGEAAYSQIANGVITPGNAGYQGFDPYPSPGGQGNPAKCRSLLVLAGYGSGLSLNVTYDGQSATSAAIFDSVRQSLRRCGIRLMARPKSAGKLYLDLDTVSATDKPGTYDLAVTGWYPDWFGDNARSTIAPLLGTDCSPATTNFGCFSSPRLDRLIRQAESAPTIARAATLWHEADLLAMQDAAVVPLLVLQAPLYSSARVHQYCPPGVRCPTAVVSAPNIGGPDITNVWLSPH